jgi:D-glutamate cyclase
VDRLALIDRIEAVAQQEVGRNVAPLFAAARGGLRGAATALADTAGTVGLITGFYVPSGTPPAAETDGPAGAALLARGLTRVGISVRVCTDAPCADACAAALAAAGVADVPLDIVPLGGSITEMIAVWRARDVRLALAIERCGRTADGVARNMRGDDVGAFTALLDDLFLAGPWQTIAIGDGGNEIGMGALPHALIARHVVNGEVIACTTPAAHLIVTGVSHWGAYALLAALAAIRADWRGRLLDCLDPALDRAILQATVRQGPAVDGVTGRHSATIDSLPYEVHGQKLRAVRALIDA